MPLQHSRSFVKYASSFMLEWMHWTWKSGSLLVAGKPEISILLDLECAMHYLSFLSLSILGLN